MMGQWGSLHSEYIIFYKYTGKTLKNNIHNEIISTLCFFSITFTNPLSCSISTIRFYFSKIIHSLAPSLSNGTEHIKWMGKMWVKSCGIQLDSLLCMALLSRSVQIMEPIFMSLVPTYLWLHWDFCWDVLWRQRLHIFYIVPHRFLTCRV